MALFLCRYCVSSFCLVGVFCHISPFWIGNFPSLPFEHHADAGCRSHGVLILMSTFRHCFVSFCLYFVLLYYVRIDGVTLSNAIINNFSIGIRTGYWKAKGEGISSIWCSAMFTEHDWVSLRLGTGDAGLYWVFPSIYTFKSGLY